jgi:hypothetical protein
MASDKKFRDHVIYLLTGGGAHCGFSAAVEGLPKKLCGVRPEGIPYSPWELVEHIRIAQYDILEFSRNPDYESPEWPDGYWPESPEPPDNKAWNQSMRQFKEDHQAMIDLVRDPAKDLFEPFPWGDGQTLLREALLVADHNAYHVGQLITVRRALGAWKES